MQIDSVYQPLSGSAILLSAILAAPLRGWYLLDDGGNPN